MLLGDVYEVEVGRLIEIGIDIMIFIKTDIEIDTIISATENIDNRRKNRHRDIFSIFFQQMLVLQLNHF
jgi:hypothetical protein